jgi:hypothetical protein
MVARKPLRQKLEEQKRIEFVSSTRRDTADGPVYHVDIKERPGTEKITWIEKATQRDFAIGISLGGLAVLTMMTLTGGAGLPFIAPSMLPFIGAVVGGISDFRRNDKELKEGVDICKPAHLDVKKMVNALTAGKWNEAFRATGINRDMVKSALGFGFMAKLLLIVVSVAVASSGLPIPGAEAMTAAWANGGGLLTQIGNVASLLPEAIGWGALGIGAAFGAAKGAEIGYTRMQIEYKAAQTKNESPHLGVSMTPEQSLGVPEMIANVVAPTVLPVGLAGDVVAAAQSAVDQRTAINERKEWHPKTDQKLGFTFTNAIAAHQFEGKRPGFDSARPFAEQVREKQAAASLTVPSVGS